MVYKFTQESFVVCQNTGDSRKYKSHGPNIFPQTCANRFDQSFICVVVAMQLERYACFPGSPPTCIQHLKFRFLTTLFVCPEQRIWRCFVWVKISTKHRESNIEIGSLTYKNHTGTQHPMCTLRVRQGPDFARVPHSNISQFEMFLHPQKEVLTRSIPDYLLFSLDLWLWKEQL